MPVILAEIDPDSDTVTKTYIWNGGEVLAQHDGDITATRYSYLHDRLGSVRLLLDPNASVVNRYTYNPYGQRLTTETEETVSNPFQFTGQFYDSNLQQTHNRARQYATALARFTARDPFMGNLNDPVTVHAYLYCLNNPVSVTDPTGEVVITDLMSTTFHWASMTYRSAQVGVSIMNRVEQFAQGVSIRNVLYGAIVDVAVGMAADKAIGFLVKVGTPLLNRAGKQVYAYAKRGGHHIMPKWAGGNPKQLLHKLGWAKHRKLEGIIKKRMRAKFNLRIGGWGGSYEDIGKVFEKTPGMHADVLNELTHIYTQFDAKHGTTLVEGLIWNLNNVVNTAY